MHPAGCKLGPDLVMSSGKKMYLKKRVALRLPYLTVLKSGLLQVPLADSMEVRSPSVRSRLVGEALVLCCISIDIVSEKPALLRHGLVHDGPVELVHLAVAEHLGESAERLVRAGEDHDAACRAVQPVRQAQEHIAGLVVLLLEIGFDDVLRLPLCDKLIARRIEGLAAMLPYTLSSDSFSFESLIDIRDDGKSGAFSVQSDDLSTIYRFIIRILQRLGTSAQVLLLKLASIN